MLSPSVQPGLWVCHGMEAPSEGTSEYLAGYMSFPSVQSSEIQGYENHYYAVRELGAYKWANNQKMPQVKVATILLKEFKCQLKTLINKILYL